MSTGLDELVMETISEDGVVPESRLKDAKSARAVHFVMAKADESSAAFRARHQSMLDGEPPYDQEVLRANGQGSRTNVNWGYAEEVIDTVMGGAIDMDVSVERLARIPLKREAVPDDDIRFEKENLLSDEVSRCIRGWGGYAYQRQQLSFYTFAHGVGIGYFPDTRDWRFRSAGLGTFCLPRGTRVSEDRIPVASFIEYYEVHELYDKIRDEKKAEASGWNVKAVKRAILKASPDETERTWSTANWEALMAKVRDNDYNSMGRSSKIGVIYLWVQEFSGKVSICAVSEKPVGDGSNGEDGDDFLYKGDSDYEDLRDGLRIFSYGIGTNGRVHSVSGILRKIFPRVQALNRVECGMVDGVALNSGVIFQPKTEEDLEAMKLVNLGPMTIGPSLDRGTFVERSMPNLAQGSMPVIADLRNTIFRRAGQFQGSSDLGGGGSERKTRTQILAELEALGKVGATQGNLWYPPWTGLLKSMIKRIFRKGYDKTEPGGREVATLMERLKAKGFPMEALKYIDYDAITAERAIGAGSSTARAAALDQLSQYAGEFDEIGRYNLLRDKTAATLNGSYEMVARYAPPREQIRPSNDAKMAAMENSLMELGQEQPVFSNDLHLIHLDVHNPFLAALVHHIDEGSVPIDDKSVMAMTLIYQHEVAHLEQVQMNQAVEQKVRQYRQILQNLSETIGNAQRHLEAEKKKAAEESAQEGGGGELSLESRTKLAEADAKIAMMNKEGQMKLDQKEREHQQQLMHKAQDFHQDAALKDGEMAGSMIAHQKETDQKVSAAQRLADQKEESAKNMAEIKAKQAAQKPKPAPKKK